MTRKFIRFFSAFAILFVFATYLSKQYINANMKYVLIWTSPKSDAFYPLHPGSVTFYKKNCPVQNCFVTSDRDFLGNVTSFDVILFRGSELVTKNPQTYLPKERSALQSYIFTTLESSHNYALPDTRYHGVFNFTWTYSLNSDISFKYMLIKNREGKVIGPNKTIDWMNIDYMLPINDTIKRKLANKKVAAAWFVSNCKTISEREVLALKIGAKLQKYNMTLHIYGACGSKSCPRKYMYKCLQMLQRDYYFYFAFENSLSEDYVTEKLQYALRSYVVPIVYGGANYTRFMPDGIYLNAGTLSVTKLVKIMVEAINNKDMYYNFFKWHNHYSYHHPEESADTDPYCSLCSFINKVNQSESSTIEDLYDWWNPTDPMKVIQSVSKWRF